MSAREHEIRNKTAERMRASDFEALLVYGFDNIRYFSGAVVPFESDNEKDVSVLLIVAGEEPVLLAPRFLRDSYRNGGFLRNVQTYDAAGGETVEELAGRLIEEHGLSEAMIGITRGRIPQRRFDRLEKLLPKLRFFPADDLLRQLRMVKTDSEQELLEEAARRTDHALAAAAHHVMVYAARPEKGLSEIIRVHCLERGLDMTGYESLAVGASGEHAARRWPEAPCFGVGLGKQLAEGELVRIEVRSSLDGYWSDAARLLTMGIPSEAQRRVYDKLNSIRGAFLDRLQPGTTCAGLAGELIGLAEKEGGDLILQAGLGHGIGVTPFEPPFIHPTDKTVLQPGMVLVTTPTLRGPKGELVRSFDTVIIGKEGPEQVGWYKDWSSPYEAASSYQHGGG
jgi:Xaa-Pro dipeptidase